MASVLVTGGAGYIGSHVICALGAAGRHCVSIDNYANSSPESLRRVARLVPGAVEALEADIRDTQKIASLVRGRDIESVIHLAGLKAVGESVEDPARYHDNNVRGTERLLEALQESPIRAFVFSSSATVYGTAAPSPIAEDAPTAPGSPYGENKLEIERMLEARARSDASWRVVNLRYFNPVGAHESGTIGEDPAGTPNNLMPFICQVAVGRRDRLRIFGADYPTRDGTGVRDYIHVLDLAEGHVAALDWLQRGARRDPAIVNLGTGRGVSVLELVDAFERVNGVRVPREIAARRPGDIAECFADPSRARELFGWRARRGLEEMCRDAWRWQEANPEGFRG